jgi:hypothetical protein
MNAIAEFQKLWGAADSRVDPHPGRTIQRLNLISSPLRLQSIGLVSYRKGAYSIGYDDHLQNVGGIPKKGYRLFLAVGDDKNTLEITGRNPNQVMGADNLPALLKLIANKDSWGKAVECQLHLRYGSAPVSSSNVAKLKCPVKPYEGALTFHGFFTADPKLTYTGNGNGRRLTKPIDGKYYFRDGVTLETENPMRGFDCTTFPMALFADSISRDFSMADERGTALAEELVAVPCHMEAKKEADIKKFFADKTKGHTGLYFMWSAVHVILVKDGMFHEFRAGGYKQTRAGSFNRYDRAPQKLWWIRKLPAWLKP